MTILQLAADGRERVSGRCLWQPGNAAALIGHAAERLQPGDKVILVCRVSSCEQNHTGNLDDQVANLGRRAAALGVVVVDVVRFVGSGYDPWWLASAVDDAKREGAVFFAETTDRFVRSILYHSKNEPLKGFADAQARQPDLDGLAYWAAGVELVTDLPPNASPKEVRSYQRKRGQAAKGCKGGRPRKTKPGDKKRRREALKPRALKWRSQGLSIRDIAEYLGVPPSTLQGWL